MRSAGAKPLHDLPKKISPKYPIAHSYPMGYLERVKAFFEKPPEHNLKVGDLVTCTCHGGVAVILTLYDNSRRVDDEGEEYPKMNMARIWWISKPNSTIARSWIHTINRLNKYGEHWPE